MKKSVIIFALCVYAATAMAQVDTKQLDSLNVLLSSKLLKYNFPHWATQEGIYLTELMAGTPQRDEHGQYPYFIDFIQWADITSVTVKPNSNGDGRVLVLYGAVKDYMFGKTPDMTYDGRSYKYSRDKDWISLFCYGQAEYETLDKIAGLIRTITGK